MCPPTEAERLRAWLPEATTPETFVVPFAGHAIMIESGEIVCDVINDFLVGLDPHLSHAWQLSYTAGEKWSLKNEEKVFFMVRNLTVVDDCSKRVRSHWDISSSSNESISLTRSKLTIDSASNRPGPFPLPSHSSISQGASRYRYIARRRCCL